MLEASNIVVLLEPYHRNLGKRLVKTPKLYLLDTGLACYLLGIRSVDELRASTMLGALFETHALGQMIRWHANRGLPPDIYFFRDRDGHEVDFVMPVAERLKLYECKWSEAPETRSRGFDAVEKMAGAANIISKSIISSARGARKVGDTWIEDSIEGKTLPIRA